MAKFEMEPTEARCDTWSVLHVNVVKVRMTAASDQYKVGDEIDCMQLVLGSCKGEQQTIMLEPGDGVKLMNQLILRLNDYGFPPAQEITKFLSERYPRKEPDR